MKRGWGVAGTVILLLLKSLCDPLLRAEAYRQNVRMSWPNHGGGLSNDRAATAEKKLNKETLDSLSLKWTVHTGYDVSATPSIDGKIGVVYFPCWNGMLYAVEQDSGKLVWEKNLTELTAPIPGLAEETIYLPEAKRSPNFTPLDLNDPRTGLADLVSRSTPTIAGRLLLVGLYNPCYLLALDRASGCVVWFTRLDTHPYAVVTQSPAYFEGGIYIGTSSAESGVAVCCTFQAAFFKLVAKTGKIVWRTPMLPDNNNIPGQYTGAAIWGSSPPIDVERRLVYIATGQTYSVPAEVNDCELARQNLTNPPYPDPCIPDDILQEAIVAMDLDTGKIAWAKQLGGFDTWTYVCYLSPVPLPNCPSILGKDYDFGEAPFMLTIKQADGSWRDVVTVGQKSGIVHTLDRETGDIVWQTEAGPGGPSGGSSWGMTTDGERVFTMIINDQAMNFTLVPSSTVITWGGWVGMNASTGEVIWSTANPYPGLQTNAPLTYVNGIVFGASLGNYTSASPQGAIVALDAETGAVLWTYMTEGGAAGGVSISDGCIFQPVGGSIGSFGLNSSPAIHGRSTISLCVP